MNGLFPNRRNTQLRRAYPTGQRIEVQGNNREPGFVLPNYM